MRRRGADTTIRLNRAAVHVTGYMICARPLCPITMATHSSKRYLRAERQPVMLISLSYKRF
jgi:hypothetical protein